MGFLDIMWGFALFMSGFLAWAWPIFAAVWIAFWGAIAVIDYWDEHHG